MCISTEISIGDIVQIIVGFVALWYARTSFRKANEQFKENQKDSKELSNIIENQYNLSKKQLQELKDISKPKLYCKIVNEENVYQRFGFATNIKNIGRKPAFNIIRKVVLIDVALTKHYNEEIMIDDVLDTEEPKQYQFTFKEGNSQDFFIYLKFQWLTDEESGESDFKEMFLCSTTIMHICRIKDCVLSQKEMIMKYLSENNLL